MDSALKISWEQSLRTMWRAFRVSGASIGAPVTNTYTYAGMGYANPHAVTQLSNGYSTSTFAHDQNGNVTQKTTDGVTTRYVWDYANRLTAVGQAFTPQRRGDEGSYDRQSWITVTTSSCSCAACSPQGLNIIENLQAPRRAARMESA